MFQIAIAMSACGLIILLAFLARQRPNDPQPRHASALNRRKRRLYLPKGVLHALEKCLQPHPSFPALTMICENCRQLALLYLDVQQSLRKIHALPCNSSGEISVMQLCAALLKQHDCITPEILLSALRTWQQTHPSTFQERQSAPVCLKLTLLQHLDDILQEIRQDIIQHARGRTLAHRIGRVKHSEKILQRIPHIPSVIHAVLSVLREKQQSDLLGGMEEMLNAAGLNIAEAEEHYRHRQEYLVQRISAIMDTYRTFQSCDWTALAEDVDPLHHTFSKDPAGVYERMDAASRLSYRRQTAYLAQLFHCKEMQVAETCLHLAQQSPADGLYDHVGFYLLDKDGLPLLRRRLKAHHGIVPFFAIIHRNLLQRCSVTAASLLWGWLLLHRGCPLWLMPLLLIALNPLFRQTAAFLLDALPSATPPPALDIPEITEQDRVLLVLPAVLKDAAYALRMVKQLSQASAACPHGAIDCLLFADFSDHPTISSTADATIMATAAEGLQAISRLQRVFYYIQRQRSWSAKRRTYCGKDGKPGMLHCLQRLLCEGECDEAFDHASFDTQTLYRRYAYVLLIEPDVTLYPDSLRHMIGLLSHPLHHRRDTSKGVRGYSMVLPTIQKKPASFHTRLAAAAPPPNDMMCMLYRPDALWAATQGHGAQANSLSILKALAGCLHSSTPIFVAPPSDTDAWLDVHAYRALQNLRVLPWLLPLIQRNGRLMASPLQRKDVFHLRLSLYRFLTPFCQAVLFLYATLARQEAIFLFSLLPFFARKPLQTLANIVFFPLRLIKTILATSHTLFPNMLSFPTDIHAVEMLTQAIAALSLGALSHMPLPLFLPGCILAAAWACFLPARHLLDATAAPRGELSEAAIASLRDIAAASWRYFESAVTEKTHHLPPDSLQEDPWKGSADTTSPRSMAMYLLACIAALELKLEAPAAIAARIQQAIDAIEALPTWQGLPFSRYYRLADLAPGDTIDAASCGLLCAALLTTAQAVRTYLADLPPDAYPLPVRLDTFAQNMQLRQLFDAYSGTFACSIRFPDEHRSETHLDLLASESLLLSYVAVQQRQIPAAHFARLNRVMVRTRSGLAFVSQHGDMSSYLLPALLLPFMQGTLLHQSTQTVLSLQRKKHSAHPWGISACASWRFDADMRYLQYPFGLPVLALEAAPPAQTISPYASALCLPWLPIEAAGNLEQLRALSMLGKYGFFDSLDLSGDTQPIVRLYDAPHQGMILCAICNTLCDQALQRHFTQPPQVRAYLPLLWDDMNSAPALSERLMHHTETVIAAPSFSRKAEATVFPLDVHVLSGAGTTLMITAQGNTFIRIDETPLTSWPSQCTSMEGLRLYVSTDSGHSSLTSPAIPGETRFEEGCARFHRFIDEIESLMTITLDPLSGCMLQSLELHNRSDRDLLFDIEEDILLEAIPAKCIETSLNAWHISLIKERSFCQWITSDAAFTRLTTDNPRLLRLHAQVRLGAQGRTTLTFHTGAFAGHHASHADYLHTLSLARLHSRVLTDSLGLSQQACAELSRAFGALLFSQQPHQGAMRVLQYGADALQDIGLNPTRPFLLVAAATPQCKAILSEAIALVRWLHAMQLDAAIYVLVQGDHAAETIEAAQALMSSSMLPSDRYVALRASALPAGMRETIEAHARLILYEDSDLKTQLAFLTTRVAVAPHFPIEPLSPAKEQLLFDNGIGGFADQTGDYVLRQIPAAMNRELLPHEYLLIQTDDELMDPLHHARVQLSAGIISWQASHRQFESHFYAGAMPEHTAFLRVLRLHNKTDQPLRLAISYARHFASGDAGLFLTPVENGVTASSPDKAEIEWLSSADGNAEESILSAGAFFGLADGIPAGLYANLPSAETGTVALLRRPLLVEPHAFASCTWVCGTVSVCDEIEQVLSYVQQRGGSTILRIARQRWAQRLARVTVSTPDPALDLLMNRLLPYQCLQQASHLSLSALLWLDPVAARATVINTQAPLDTALYLVHTEDSSVLNERISAGASLHDAVLQQLTSVQLGAHGLLLADGREDLTETLRYAATLRALLPFAREEHAADMQDMLQRLQASVEHTCWTGVCYADPESHAEHALVQALCSYAGMDRMHTQQALDHAWKSLYDPAVGILHTSDNRTQSIFTAAVFLGALADVGMTEEAWTLTSAMNPVLRSLAGDIMHHSHTMPWLVPAEIRSDGRAVYTEDRSAAWYYVAILERLLGVSMKGNQISIAPRLPAAWEQCTVTLQHGASTWRFNLSRTGSSTCDGEPLREKNITLVDDGRIHHVRLRIST